MSIFIARKCCHILWWTAYGTPSLDSKKFVIFCNLAYLKSAIYNVVMHAQARFMNALSLHMHYAIADDNNGLLGLSFEWYGRMVWRMSSAGSKAQTTTNKNSFIADIASSSVRNSQCSVLFFAIHNISHERMQAAERRILFSLRHAFSLTDHVSARTWEGIR